MKRTPKASSACGEALAHAAIDTLEAQMRSDNPAVAIAAVQEILDRCGLPAARVVRLIGRLGFTACRPSRSKRKLH